MKVSSSIYLKFSRIKKISLQQNIVVNYSFLLKFNCNKFTIGNICPKLKYKVRIVSLDFFLVSFFFIEYFMNNCTWSIFHLNMLRIIFTRRHMEFRLFNLPRKWSLLSCIFTSSPDKFPPHDCLIGNIKLRFQMTLVILLLLDPKRSGLVLWETKCFTVRRELWL